MTICLGMRRYYQHPVRGQVLQRKRLIAFELFKSVNGYNPIFMAITFYKKT